LAIAKCYLPQGMRASSFRFPPDFPPQKKHFFQFLGKLPQSYFSPMFSHESITKQIIVPFRVLREMHTGQNPLHLSGSTAAHASGRGLVCPCSILRKLSKLISRNSG
jgi:hypothetical protein